LGYFDSPAGAWIADWRSGRHAGYASTGSSHVVVPPHWGMHKLHIGDVLNWDSSGVQDRAFQANFAADLTRRTRVVDGV